MKCSQQRLRDILARRDPLDFAEFGDVTHTKDGAMIFADNGASMLGVAHLDYVGWSKPRFKGGIVYCPQLDDRLGAWVLLDVLPKLGIKFDLLLTDSEELGRSTAQYFDAPREYNWIFEFDRAGIDAVMYEYETPEYCDMLASVGYEIGDGSFTDICSLTHLGCAGFNFGTGYHQQHTDECYAALDETKLSVDRFAKLYHKYSDTFLPSFVEDDKYDGYDMYDDAYASYDDFMYSRER